MPRRLPLALAVVAAFVAPSVAVAATEAHASLTPSSHLLGRGERQLSLHVAGAGASSCRLSVEPALASMPTTLTPCPDAEDLALRLPANRGLGAKTYRFTLRVGTGEVASTKVVQRSMYRVLLYGDSIAWQFAPELERQLERTGAVQVRSATFPGTSLCDGLSIASRDAAAFRPDVVVAQYVGSPFTACSQSPAYGAFAQPGWYAQLARDAGAMARSFRAAGASKVWFDAGPVHQDSSVARDATIAAYDRAVRSVGAYAERIEPYLAVEAAGDRYVAYLPCLDVELSSSRCTGPSRSGQRLNRVRSPAPDRFHLCPVSFGARQQAGCDTYSSGAFRYAAAISTPLITGWGLGPAPTP